MKKTLLLSVVASTMIMAGGTIAPVEPAVEAPAPMVEASAWNYGGQAVLYTQTIDASGNGDLFGDDSTYAAWGVQLRANNADLAYGIGAGVEVSGIVASTGSGVPAVTPGGFYGSGGNVGTTSGGITQAYLTKGFGDTSIKLGRQQLPKSLSPFAFTEGWQMFKNTFDAALVVNSSLPNTTLVYAFLKNANRSVGAYANEDGFTKMNGSDGVHMFTAQTKAIDSVTLTGTYYTASDYTDIIWIDAKTKMGGFSLAAQAGQTSEDGKDDVTAFGIKAGGKLGMFNLSAAYSTVSEDDGMGITNLGTRIKSPLYTQMVLNNVANYHAAPGSDFLKIGGTMKALGGTVKAFYGAGSNDFDATKGDYSQLDLMYVTKLTKDVKFFAAYVYTDDDMYTQDTATGSRPSENNFVRFWARYNFK